MLEILTPEQRCYFIGFMQGDGSMCKNTRNRGRLSCEINFKDVDLLDKFEKLFNIYLYVGRRERSRVTNFKSITTSIFNICSKEFRDEINFFIPYGKKSEIVRPPFLLEDKNAYLRGFLDADGSLGFTVKNRPFLSFCTKSDYIKEFILNDIKQECGIEKIINRNKRDNIYNIVLYNESAVDYLNVLYQGATLYLDRKYFKYLEILKWKRPEDERKRVWVNKKWLEWEDKVVLDENISLSDKCKLLNRTDKSVNIRIWRLNKHEK